MDSNSDRQIDWEIARLSGGLSTARRFTPAHQGSLRPCDWNLEEPEEGPLSERGDTLARNLAAYEASARRPIIESIAPMSMESEASSAGEVQPFQPVSARRNRLSRGADALWAGAAAGMSVLALGLVVMLGVSPVPSANAALPATPSTSQTTAPATMAMATEGVPFTARPMVMLDPVLVSGNASTPRARTAAPARAPALTPEAAMAASLDAISPQRVTPKGAAALDVASAGISRPAAAVAISMAGRRAASCLRPGDARGRMPVSVTFAPSGRVTSSTVDGGPFAGTTTGGCIARALRSANVAPFEGAPVTVHSSVSFR